MRGRCQLLCQVGRHAAGNLSPWQGEIPLDRRQLSPQGHGVGSSPATCRQPSASSPDSHETPCPGGWEGQGERCLGPPGGRGHSEGSDQGQAKGVTDLHWTQGTDAPPHAEPPNPGSFSGFVLPPCLSAPQCLQCSEHIYPVHLPH